MTVESALYELNIEKDEFYAIIADDGARENIYECLMHCLLKVPDLKEIAATLLQEVVIPYHERAYQPCRKAIQEVVWNID